MSNGRMLLDAVEVGTMIDVRVHKARSVGVSELILQAIDLIAVRSVPLRLERLQIDIDALTAASDASPLPAPLPVPGTRQRASQGWVWAWNED